MTESQPERQPHAVLDARTRTDKARKIRAIIEPEISLDGTWLLEIGTGSGVIAHELSKHVGNGKVCAVDVCDQRTVKDSYEFHLVNDPILPFPDKSFDIVITNHVIEHVGDHDNQILHLNEIRRVTKDQGIGYLAVPNRWRLVEPHFRLPLLSWFPQFISDKYVQLMKRGKYYDCKPLSHANIVTLFEKTNLSFEPKTFAAMRAMLEHEDISGVERYVLSMPEFMKKLLYSIIPTIIFVFRK
jgi:ubiquinone/menaquinone biosynthesis C-methylase UbiE